MGRKTTVTVVAFGGALATLALWLLGYYNPDLMATLPTGGEAALGTVFTAIFSYIIPEKK